MEITHHYRTRRGQVLQLRVSAAHVRLRLPQRSLDWETHRLESSALAEKLQALFPPELAPEVHRALERSSRQLSAKETSDEPT